MPVLLSFASRSTLLAVCIVLAARQAAGTDELAYESPFAYDDPNPQAYALSERDSKIDPRVRSHPQINFVLEKDGQPKDVQSAAVEPPARQVGPFSSNSGNERSPE